MGGELDFQHVCVLELIQSGHCSTGTVQGPGLLTGGWKGGILMSSLTQSDQPENGLVKPLNLTFIVANVVGSWFTFGLHLTAGEYRRSMAKFLYQGSPSYRL